MLPRLALGVLLLAPLLAGCVSTPLAPAPGAGLAALLGAAHLRCPATANGTCDLLATIEPERQGNEVTIAVNPKDPNNVVAGAKDYFPASAGECVWDGFYSTHDGGATFESHNVPGSPWLLTTDPGGFAPNELTQYWCLTDPSYAFGPDGTLYMGVMAYQGDPITGSKLCRGVCPQGGFNDWLFNRVSQAIAVSSDGGKTVDRISIVDSGSYPINFHDREWVATDPKTGAIYDVWTTGLLEGNMFYRSTDGGRTWSRPLFLDGSPLLGDSQGVGGLYVAAGPDDHVYVAGCGNEGPMVATSTDAGQTFGTWTLFAAGQDKGMESPFRSGMVCMLAVDTSDGPLRGMVYMVWSDTRNGNRDVYFAGMPGDMVAGGHAMDPVEAVKLNDDAGAADQFFPAIAVSPGGAVDVAWYDRRNGADPGVYDIYFTYSPDGGKTWAPNLRVTDQSSDGQYSHHQNGNVFIGDYMDIDSSLDCAWPVWVDTRAHKADVMTACIERPGEAVASMAPSSP